MFDQIEETPSLNATKEPSEDIVEHFLNLEDKVCLEEGDHDGIQKPLVCHIRTRDISTTLKQVNT